MPKSYNQKLKILYLRELLEDSDREHVITMKIILDYLGERGIKAERKSIYDDLGALRDYGLKIEKGPGPHGGYYLADHEFSLPELKLLVDAVQASKFITQKKSRELIKKLEKLAGKRDAKQLNRQVVVSERNKAGNENIYQNIDMIYSGISANRQITFKYFEWTVSKTMKLRKNGETYQVSPWYLNWDDENYYLIAYDSAAGIVKHFRVDKMLEIGLTEEKREGRSQMEDLNLADYTRKTFGMFAGSEETVTLDCENSLIGVVIDRFGTELAVRPLDEGHFRARTDVAVSPQFYGWLSGFGGRIVIQSPKKVRDGYVAYLKEITEKYK